MGEGQPVESETVKTEKNMSTQTNRIGDRSAKHKYEIQTDRQGG